MSELVPRQIDWGVLIGVEKEIFLGSQEGPVLLRLVCKEFREVR